MQYTSVSIVYLSFDDNISILDQNKPIKSINSQIRICIQQHLGALDPNIWSILQWIADQYYSEKQYTAVAIFAHNSYMYSVH